MMSRLMTPREQLVVGFMGVAVLVGSTTAVWLNREPEAPPPPPDEPPVVAEPAKTNAPEQNTVPAPPPVSEPTEVVVAVRGAVNVPGVYTMESTDRLNDLIARAGGTTQTALLDDINLAAKLIDGSTLTVPETNEPVVRDGVVTLRRKTGDDAPNPPQYTLSGWTQPDRTNPGRAAVDSPANLQASSPQPPSNDPRIDLNRATAEQLEELPGIGPVLAQSIVDYRTNAPFTTVDQLQNVRGIGPKRYESLRDLVTVGP